LSEIDLIIAFKIDKKSRYCAKMRFKFKSRIKSRIDLKKMLKLSSKPPIFDLKFLHYYYTLTKTIDL
jgi:hypothetical protein